MEFEHTDHLSGPGAVIASLPAAFGFVPHRCLAMVLLNDVRMSAVVRAALKDLIAAGSPADMVKAAASSGADGAIVIVVDDDGLFTQQMLDNLAAEMEIGLARRGVRMLHAFVCDGITEGAAWRLIGGDATGVVEDPQSSPMTALAVMSGRRMYSSREEVVALVQCSDPVRAQKLASVIYARRGHRLIAGRDQRADVEFLLPTASAAHSGELTDSQIAETVCAVRDPDVREAMIALTVSPLWAERLEALWLACARAVPRQWRADVLALLGFCAYVRGDGPLAHVALDAALEADRKHKLAGLLDVALQGGMHPRELRQLAVDAAPAARRIGAPL